MQPSRAATHRGGTVAPAMGWSWQRLSQGMHDEEEGKAHLLVWAIVLEWRDGRSALGHRRGTALTAHRWEDAKLAPGRAIIKAVWGRATRRRERGGADEPNWI